MVCCLGVVLFGIDLAEEAPAVCVEWTEEGKKGSSESESAYYFAIKMEYLAVLDIRCPYG